MIQKKKKPIKERLIDFSAFCKNIHVGDILYNINSSNAWGEFLVVAAKANVYVGMDKSPYLMLFGLKQEEDNYIFNGKRIDLTLDLDDMIPFLKVVGKCDFGLHPVIYHIAQRKELIAIYKGTDIWQYSKRYGCGRKKTSRYCKDGSTVVKTINIV